MKSIVLVIATMMLAACTTGEQASNLDMGMTPAQVSEVLGRPDGQMQQGNQLAYQYTNRLISGWSFDRADYVAVFTDGRLTGWGPGQVRQGATPNVGTLMVVPVRLASLIIVLPRPPAMRPDHAHVL